MPTEIVKPKLLLIRPCCTHKAALDFFVLVAPKYSCLETNKFKKPAIKSYTILPHDPFHMLNIFSTLIYNKFQVFFGWIELNNFNINLISNIISVDVTTFVNIRIVL